MFIRRCLGSGIIDAGCTTIITVVSLPLLPLVGVVCLLATVVRVIRPVRLACLIGRIATVIRNLLPPLFLLPGTIFLGVSLKRGIRVLLVIGIVGFKVVCEIVSGVIVEVGIVVVGLGDGEQLLGATTSTTSAEAAIAVAILVAMAEVTVTRAAAITGAGPVVRATVSVPVAVRANVGTGARPASGVSVVRPRRGREVTIPAGGVSTSVRANVGTTPA